MVLGKIVWYLDMAKGVLCSWGAVLAIKKSWNHLVVLNNKNNVLLLNMNKGILYLLWKYNREL